MINIKLAQTYCCEDISLIENYDKAVADKTQTWHCHHRLEIHGYVETTRIQMIENRLYFNRPANELIFLTKAEHTSIHAAIRNRGNKYCLGHKATLETKAKLSNSHKGNTSHLRFHHSNETKRKISEAKSGQRMSEVAKRKIAISRKGKQLSDETKTKLRHQKIGALNPNFGKHWYTNGVANIQAKECPEGFTSGRTLVKH